MNSQQSSGAGQPLTRPEDAALLCTALQETVAGLGDLMERETALLSSNRHRELADLHADKLELSRAFLRQFTTFRANADLLAANAPAQVDRLRQSLRALGSCIERNLNTVDAARAVSQGLVHAMFDFAAKRNAGPSCYGRDAAIGPGTATKPTAIALDRAL